jgi:hypothetical protein
VCAAAATTTFLATLANDSAKSLYCNSLTEDGSIFCTLNAAKNACELSASTDCTYGLPTSAGWDGDSATTYVAKYCAAKTDKTRKI